MTPEQQAATTGAWVVRAGIAQAADLVAAYHRLDLQLNLYGLSVLYDSHHATTVLDLVKNASAAVKKRAKLCFAMRNDLAAAIGPGYVLHLFQSGSYRYHHELILALAPASSPTTYLDQLPLPIATALSAVWQRNLIDNPYATKGTQP